MRMEFKYAGTSVKHFAVKETVNPLYFIMDAVPRVFSHKTVKPITDTSSPNLHSKLMANLCNKIMNL